MCGIAGIVDKSRRLGRDRLAALGAAMAGTMAHRGPDDEGVYVSADGRVMLAHRRLSIIDVSAAGHQPMLAHDGRAVVTFNGEIYNFLELKTELAELGETFTSSSDTEVLIAALQRWGAAALPKFDAMFAFGYYDLATRTLLLARDAFGEKPLYYVDTPDYFAFASELHALTGLPDFDETVSADTIAAYLCFQYVPAPRTIYQSVGKLLPGHALTVAADGRVRSEAYFEFTTSGRRAATGALDDLADELEGLLETSMRRRLISDVPLGAFLSGGVDSSTVAAIATKRLGVPLNTYSMGFEGHADSEHFDAAAIAAHLGTKHSDRVLSADTIELGRRIGAALDEPNADSSCLPTYLLCGFARENVTVALSGDGGDELFGGYGRYFVTIDEWARKGAGDRSLDWWKAGEVYLSSRILVYPDEVLRQLYEQVPGGLAAMLQDMRGAIDADGRPLLNVLREFDARTYMPGAVLAKVDRMSMQHSLEVRAPFLSIDIAKFAMRLGADDCYGQGQGKLVLKRVAERYLPRDWMSRPKRGFGLPMDLWGADKLMPALRQLLLAADCRLSDWIPRRRLERYVAHLQGDFHPYRAWALLILETWLRSHPARAEQRTRDEIPAAPFNMRQKLMSLVGRR